jgi:hydroxymethylpyrimidine pyrophosphatase-like HAD family hydrolase
MFPGARDVHQQLGLRSSLICLQGCAVHEPSGTVRHEFPLDLNLAHEVVGLARQLGYPYEWFTPLRYFASVKNPESDVYADLSGIVAEYIPSPENCGLLPAGVGIISTRQEAPTVHAELVARLGAAVHVLDFPSVTVCVSTTATKGRALELLSAELGIAQDEVVAVGDSVNDAPMLDWAGRGYAVSHGDRHALAAADEVLDMTSGDGVADLLERIAAGRPL